ncbi:hypothetical protein CHS0354_041093 [Potamilus streckersoni]|uniref:THAP-type domain-containing protein n=1 Tax=Potamilus streckersoni TaxID=2493646 RepID=A0AAE0SDR4_9BIVA|nr:hypothetical protein CHS0354_041093 [Potamilus streckersoni]
MVVCYVVGCTNRRFNDSNKGRKSFYRIPSVMKNHGPQTLELSARRRETWFARLRRDFKSLNVDNVRVCSDHFVSGRPATLYDTSDVDWAPSLKLGYDSDSTQEKTSKTKGRKDNNLPTKKGKMKTRKKLLETPQGKDYSGISPLDFVCSQEEYNKFQSVLENSCKRKKPVTRVNFGHSSEETKPFPTVMMSASTNTVKKEFSRVQPSTEKDIHPRHQILKEFRVIEGDLGGSVPQEEVLKQNCADRPNGRCPYLIVLCVSMEQERAIRKLFKAMCWPYRLKGTYGIVNYSDNIDDMKLPDDFLITINSPEDPTKCEELGTEVNTEITPQPPYKNIPLHSENFTSQETILYHTSDLGKDVQFNKESDCVKIKEEPPLDPDFMAAEPQIRQQSYDGTKQLALDGSHSDTGHVHCYNFSGSEGRHSSNTHTKCKTHNTENNLNMDSYSADKMELGNFVQDSCEIEASSDGETYLESPVCKNWTEMRKTGQRNDQVESPRERRMKNDSNLTVTCSNVTNPSSMYIKNRKVEYNYSNKLEVTENRETERSSNSTKLVKKRKFEMTKDEIYGSEEDFNQIPLVGMKQEKDSE